jgi:hypothetical protein
MYAHVPPLGASDLTFRQATLRVLRCSHSSSLSFFAKSTLHCCASCRVRVLRLESQLSPAFTLSKGQGRETA